MIAVIAEKPSVAKDIANIVGATQKCDGHLSGNGYLVTWAFGHLVQLAMPEAYGFANFHKESLPIIPLQFQLIPRQVRVGKEQKADPGVLKQLKTIKEVFKQCDKIVVATDAGREGELIFRYIYNHIGCKKPFVRLWISSLTDKAIQEGFQNLQPGQNYDNLYLSAKARSEADWLIGINASQALTIAARNGVYSLGRVQTPTLAMICNRFLENKKFVPQKYWQISLQTGKGKISFPMISVDRFLSLEKAKEYMSKATVAGSMLVGKVEKKEVKEAPPLLYDLTTLQKEANTKLNFSADTTLSIAQTLYEKKVMSYPRTGSRYISEDVFDEIPKLLKVAGNNKKFAAYVANMDFERLGKRSVDGEKVTDHHALIVTENLPTNLSPDEQAIYNLIAGRMLEAFTSESCEKEHTTVLAEAGGIVFMTKGTIVKKAAWRGVFQEKEEEEGPLLPEISSNDLLPIGDAECLTKQTQPKPLLTEATLLASMESCGKDMEDNELKAAMKDCGIGTPATRASIIETLFGRGYVERQKKSLIPTEKGLAVYETVKDKKIADVEMTGQWENALEKISKGETSPEDFKKNIEIYASQITNELLDAKFSIPDKQSYKCPKCGGAFMIYNKVAKCMNEGCGIVVFREIAGKIITENQIRTLIEKGKTEIIKGFKSKAGKQFPAFLVLDNKEWRVKFEFVSNSKS